MKPAQGDVGRSVDRRLTIGEPLLIRATVTGEWDFLQWWSSVRISRVWDARVAGERSDWAKAAFQPGNETGSRSFIHAGPV